MTEFPWLKVKLLYFFIVVYRIFILLYEIPELSIFESSSENKLPGKYEKEHNGKIPYSWWRGIMSDSLIEQSHPHAGAQHENGTIGMVVDPSPRRLYSYGLGKSEILDILSSKFSISYATICPNASFGIETELGNKAVQKVRNGLKKSMRKLRERSNATNKKTTRVKILCMIYTYEGSHHQLHSVIMTWASKCDGFIAASNTTDHSIGAINLLHSGPEEYGNMWQKVRSMLAYIYHNYLEEFDFFYICGDDVYAVIENMRVFLEGEQVENVSKGILDHISLKFYNAKKWENVADKSVPLRICTPMLYGGISCAGGPGYILNKRAVQLFGEKGLNDYQVNLTSSQEDIVTGRFFSKHGVYPSASQDPEGAYRFWAAPLRSMMFNGVNSPICPNQLSKLYGLSNNRGLESVSEEQIAVHIKDEKVRLEQMNSSVFEHIIRQHAILYDWCSP